MTKSERIHLEKIIEELTELGATQEKDGARKAISLVVYILKSDLLQD